MTAGDRSAPGARGALAELCGAYWYPLYAFVRRRGRDPESAEDLVQGFFATLLERESLAAVDRSKGRFRSFLVASCAHYLSNRHDHRAEAQARTAARTIVPDRRRQRPRIAIAAEPSHDLTPERLFERQWATTLLELVLGQLESEMAAAGKAPTFVVLKPALVGSAERLSYARAPPIRWVCSEERYRRSWRASAPRVPRPLLSPRGRAHPGGSPPPSTRRSENCSPHSERERHAMQTHAAAGGMENDESSPPRVGLVARKPERPPTTCQACYYQAEQARAHINIGRVGVMLSPTGKPEEALEACRKALAIRQRLVDANPANVSYQLEISQAHNILGGLLARQKRFAEAFAAFDACLAIQQKLANSNPKLTFAEHLGGSYVDRGSARVWSGQPAEAAADLRQAVELWDKLTLGPDGRLERSRALALLAGLGGDAKSGVTKAEAATFAIQAVAGLRDAFSHGWGWLDKLKEPDFDALLGRDDFKKLVAEVEAKAGPKSSR